MVGESRAQRNTKEKHRRMHMKNLIAQLSSLMPSASELSMPEILDEATSYINHLQKNEESLKRRRALLKGEGSSSSSSSTRLPRMNITTTDSTLELNLICGLNRNFMLHEIISVLQEEAVQVVNVTQVNSGDQVIFTIKSQMKQWLTLISWPVAAAAFEIIHDILQAIISRIGMETSRVQGRLEELLLEINASD